MAFLSDVTFWVAVLAMVGTLTKTLLDWRRQATRDRTDTASMLTGSALQMFKESRAEVASLRQQIAELEAEVQLLKAEIEAVVAQNRELRSGVRILTNQVKDADRFPIWSLDAFDESGRGLAPID